MNGIGETAMDRQIETTMSHHIFTLSVGILTFALIVLNVANAADQDSDPTPNQPQVAALLENTQKVDVGNESGYIVQSREEGGESGSQAMTHKNSSLSPE
jgi:hypothetical protein